MELTDSSQETDPEFAKDSYFIFLGITNDQNTL